MDQIDQTEYRHQLLILNEVIKGLKRNAFFTDNIAIEQFYASPRIGIVPVVSYQTNIYIAIVGDRLQYWIEDDSWDPPKANYEILLSQPDAIEDMVNYVISLFKKELNSKYNAIKEAWEKISSA